LYQQFQFRKGWNGVFRHLSGKIDFSGRNIYIKILKIVILSSTNYRTINEKRKFKKNTLFCFGGAGVTLPQHPSEKIEFSGGNI